MGVITLGELLVEFPRNEVGMSLGQVGDFIGPFPAGAPAIFADAVAKLGHSCGLIGVVGEDEFGKLIKRKLEDDGVDTSRIRAVSDRTTGTSFVTYFRDGSRKFIFYLKHAAAGQLSPEDVDLAYISRADFLHLTGSTLSVSNSSRESCYKAVKLAKENGVRVSFDPNIRTELLDLKSIRKICRPVLEKCDLILPNTEEAELLTGEKDIEKSARKFQDWGIEMVVIKRGKSGSTIVTDRGRIDVPSFSVKEVDPTGAGDSYDAGFICALMDGKTPEEAARFANAVGALSVTEWGGMGGIPTREKVKDLMLLGKIK